jgi:hypothetical protein
MRPSTWTILRDAGSWIGGWLIIFKQAGILFDPPPQTNETLVWMAAVLIGVPGVAQLWLARYGQSTPTAGSSLSPPSPESSPSSPGAP